MRQARAKAAGRNAPAGRARKASAAPLTSLRALHPAAARWIGALIRMTAPHPALTAILDVVERMQEEPYRTNFVLLGEPGTGKEGLARALHHLTCPDGPLVRLDVAGFSDEDALAALVATAERLRRAEGGGTGGVRAAASHAPVRSTGTLLIEEAAGLGPRTQAALIRLLKSGRIDAGGPDNYVNGPESAGEGKLRVNAIAMSDRDLPSEVRAGRFRHDLYWRLARIVLTLPPLRERLADLGPAAVWMGNRILRDAGLSLELVLAEDYERLAGSERARAIELPDAAIQALAGHDWPGNFRELEAVLERALLLHRSGSTLGADAVARARQG